MAIALITYPGSNRDRDMLLACQRLGTRCTRFYAENRASLRDFDAVILPGGFSYGDYLRPGAIAARMPLMKDLFDYAKHGGRILGVCNGFQILCEMALLPGALMTNHTSRFFCRPVQLRQVKSKSLWTRLYQENEQLIIPCAHHCGRYTCDRETLARLKDNAQIVWRYDDTPSDRAYSGNPNGSMYDIAGLTDSTGAILGVMPHPENALETRVSLGITNDGLRLFQSIL